MSWSFVIILSFISVAIIYGALFFLKNRITGSISAKRKELTEQIKGVTNDITELINSTSDLMSQNQLDWITKQVIEAEKAIATEKQILIEIERKLDDAQDKIQEKEQYHQELKTAKAEEEERLAELLSKYEDVSKESVGLEQRLAISMKQLDEILETLELTIEQRAVLQELSENLTASGARLRELILEYETVNGRLKTLSRQLVDLEDEYTKLVEQQLGE